MDKFYSLRNSIRQILEQEEQLGRMSPEDRKKLVDMLSQQKPKNDSMSQDSAMDDEQVKKISTDTGNTAPIIVDEKAIDDILYRNKYKIGYVEYNGLMHLLCVLKVYGQNNPLPQDLKDFISLVRDYTLGLFDRQQQGLAASHNISNKNRLVEVDSHSVHDLVKHIKIIIGSFYPLAGKGKKLRHDNVANSITAANTIISQGLGFFTEVLFYTYVTDFSLWENKEEEFNVLSKVFDLRLKDLKTDIDTYSASLDFAVMYFLLYEVEDKSRKSYNNILNNYIDYDQWNSRKEDVDRLANQYSFKYNEPLNHCIEILKKLQHKFNKSKWITGQGEGEAGMAQYDLWLVEQTEDRQEVVHAKIDIKTQLSNRVIAPTKSKHEDIGAAKYFGVINFEKSSLPFINTGFGDFEYTVKYLIITQTDVNKLVKPSINIVGKEYEKIFALGDGDNYHPKEYSLEDFNSSRDLFTLTNYESELPYKVEKTKPKTTTTFSLNDLSDKEIDIEFIKKYFNLGKIYSSPNFNDKNKLYKKAKANLNTIKNLFKGKLFNKLSNFNIEDFPIMALPIDTNIKLSKDFMHGRDYLEIIEKIKKNKDKKSLAKFFHINHKELNKIIEESFEESLTESDLKFPFYMQIDGRRKANTDELYSILNNFIEVEVKEVFKAYYDIIYSPDITVKNTSHKNTVPLDLLMYFIKEEHNEGLLFKLDSQYKKVINAAFTNNYEEVTAESYRQTKSLLRNVIKNILQEADKKSYSGSHPEERYGWSAKEEHFMFDLPGLTTWEKDRQRVKEYLRSMGMLAPKKEKKK